MTQFNDLSKTEQAIVEWLVEGGYYVDDAIDDVEAADVQTDDGITVVRYANGFVDEVIIEDDLVVEHLNETDSIAASICVSILNRVRQAAS